MEAHAARYRAGVTAPSSCCYSFGCTAYPLRFPVLFTAWYAAEPGTTARRRQPWSLRQRHSDPSSHVRSVYAPSWQYIPPTLRVPGRTGWVSDNDDVGIGIRHGLRAAVPWSDCRSISKIAAHARTFPPPHRRQRAPYPPVRCAPRAQRCRQRVARRVRRCDRSCHLSQGES